MSLPPIECFSFGNRMIGPGWPALIIGEIAQAHDGSLGLAHAYIDAVANAGADAIKFQTHFAHAESTQQEPWRVRFSYQDRTRFDYWERTEFTPDQWKQLQEHAETAGLIFLSSPFSEQALEMLDAHGQPAWKIASGEVNNLLLLERIARTGKPILLSSGMSSIAELDAAVAVCQDHEVPFAIFQCTSEYPCRPERVGLDLLPQLRERFRVPVGLSDHSGTIYASLAAATMGVELIEVHVTMSREMFGPDVTASVTTSELKQLVQGVRFIERAKTNDYDKNKIADELQGMRQTFGQSLVLRVDLPAGTALEKSHLVTKKIGMGLPSRMFREFLGRQLVRPVNANEPLTEDMLTHRSPQ